MSVGNKPSCLLSLYIYTLLYLLNLTLIHILHAYPFSNLIYYSHESKTYVWCNNIMFVAPCRAIVIICSTVR